ncbi:MAG: YggS family pyridoxal phosphate-dependent enzyme [Paracoccus sp. (in: a-proteobacteria)]|uniref:YggS family pyridoxal phosphate-dependent enzyme n=1 Tax=Paracoccus sp. TaxID=267 RepID=UPI0026DF8C1B|nr:YggS family pyridoxal phosphate-dependent enzyme [Paracoccus sp. (in: a-proteobacteria)]MDO5621484.1 YggS family pyridoxal phosphate-dependent enzyme [Paracoccus sp. (in: a-proteobacteria)]
MGLEQIKTRIAGATAAAGRTPDGVTLIAVSKVQPTDRVRAVLDAGQRVFGENYVQETQGKWPGWRAEYPGVSVHMIGPLQTNKAKLAFDLFDAIHTLDRESLLAKLARLADQAGRCPDLFVQVNTGAEAQKAGISPADLDGFMRQVRDSGLRPRGLMCIPPDGADPVPHFRQLRQMAEVHGLPDLSMGMSADFEAAIAEGATFVRVGSAIFGARDYT